MELPSESSINPTLLLPASASLVIAGTLFVLGRMFGSVVLVAASAQWLLLFLLVLGARSQVLRPTSESTLPVRRLFVALLFLVVSLPGATLVDGYAFVAVPSLDDFLRLSVLMVGLAAASAVMSAVFQAVNPSVVRDSHGLVKIGRIGVWLGLIGAASVFAAYQGWPAFEDAVAVVLLSVPVVLAAELLGRALFGFIRRPAGGSAFGADLFMARLFGSSYNPIQSVFTCVEDTFGVDVRSSWALGFLRKASFPLLASLAAFAWALSAFVVVDESQLAVRERLGKVKDGEVLQPGLNIGLPWPFDRIQIVDTERVRSIPLGFSGAKADANALWTQYHADEEYNLLIGNGRDLVTVNAELQYRIRDIHAWIYGCQNPAQALETLAYRVLMEATVDRTLDEVLSQDIGEFSAKMQAALQAQANSKGLGVELIALNLRGLHPPVTLAAEYQSVIAAQLDRTTYIIDAEAYRESTVPRAKSSAEAEIRMAAADRIHRVSVARGEAIAFEALEAQYSANPDLYRFRRRLETLEQVLEEKPYHVIDARIERDGGALWFLQ